MAGGVEERWTRPRRHIQRNAGRLDDEGGKGKRVESQGNPKMRRIAN